MKYAITISETQSRRALQQAVRSQGQVILEPRQQPDRSLLGFVTSGDDDVLVVELTGGSRPWLVDLVGRHVGVQLYLEERYLFDSKVLAGPSWHDAEQLTLECPRTLQVIQRRRFWRAQLAPSSSVTIRWTHAGRAQVAKGPLLNVSAEGLACKLESGAAQLIAAGIPLVCEFRLPDTHASYRFRAVVRNSAPASDDACIVGMEFDIAPEDADGAAAQQALRDALYRPRPESAEVPAP